MKSRFPLFNSHLDLAHFWWKSLIIPSDIVLDMTAGNGHDTQYLSSLNPKKVIAIDIQEQAVNNTKLLCPEAEVYLKDHTQYPLELENESIKLAVYNLGWLPGSNKACTTVSDNTLKSIQNLIPKIKPGGMVSITCYPGHPEGKTEQELLLKELSSLNPSQVSLCHHEWLNRNAAPSLILLQKAIS